MASTSRWGRLFGGQKDAPSSSGLSDSNLAESSTSLESFDNDIFDFDQKLVDSNVRHKRRRILVMIIVVALMAIAGGVTAGVVLGTRSSDKEKEGVGLEDIVTVPAGMCTDVYWRKMIGLVCNSFYKYTLLPNQVVTSGAQKPLRSAF